MQNISKQFTIYQWNIVVEQTVWPWLRSTPVKFPYPWGFPTMWPWPRSTPVKSRYLWPFPTMWNWPRSTPVPSGNWDPSNRFATTHLPSQSASLSANQPACQPASQPACQPASKPDSQPASPSARQPVTLSGIQPTSQPVNQPSSQPTKDSFYTICHNICIYRQRQMKADVCGTSCH